MNRSEAAQLLAVLTAYDRRTVGETDVQVWAHALADIRLGDAVEAVHQHHRTTSEWLDPYKLRKLVSAVRAERLARHDHELVPPPELSEDPAAAVAWLREERARVADGWTPPTRRELVERPDVTRALPGVFRRVPSR